MKLIGQSLGIYAVFFFGGEAGLIFQYVCITVGLYLIGVIG
jgi:hypothetical protein